MKKLLLIFLLFTSIFIYGQHSYTVTIAAGDSVGGIIKLAKGEIPSGAYTADPLYNNTGLGTTDTTKSLHFYVFFGDTTGQYALATPVTGWYLLSAVDDATTTYSASIENGVFTGFSPTVFYPLMSNPYMNLGSYNGSIYVQPCIHDAIKDTVSLKIITRNY